MGRAGKGSAADDSRRLKLVGAVIAILSVPVLMTAVSEGLVPAPAVAEPVWWVLPLVTVGYWAVLLMWVRRT